MWTLRIGTENTLLIVENESRSVEGEISRSATAQRRAG